MLIVKGKPLGDLQVLTVGSRGESNVLTTTNVPATLKSQIQTPGRIVFIRNRILYARAALNAQGNIRFGLRHIRKYFL
jgi:telomerase reverse transcriptase